MIIFLDKVVVILDLLKFLVNKLEIIFDCVIGVLFWRRGEFVFCELFLRIYRVRLSLTRY